MDAICSCVVILLVDLVLLSEAVQMCGAQG